MNLKYHWFCYKQVISPRICDAIVQLLHNSNKSRATIGLTKDKKEKEMTKKKKSFLIKQENQLLLFVMINGCIDIHIHGLNVLIKKPVGIFSGADLKLVS